jgi:hypothetical protein
MADNAQLLAKALLLIVGSGMISKLGNLIKMFKGLGNVAQSTATTVTQAVGGSGGRGATGSQTRHPAGTIINGKKVGGQFISQKQSSGGAAGSTTSAGGTATGGIFKNLISGAKGLASKLNPLSYLKEVVKEAGGAKGLFKNSLKKIPLLNTILTGFFAYNDIKSLLENPVDENGKPLSKDQINQQVGKIVAGGLGGILGGALGTALGGPIGTIVGSMGGDWLFKNLLGLFPDAAAGLGEVVTPFFEPKTPVNGEIPAEDYVIKTLPQDTIVGAGGTKLGRTDEMVTLLQELISVIKQGGNVYLDGTKVGTAMAVSTYKIQ